MDAFERHIGHNEVHHFRLNKKTILYGRALAQQATSCSIEKKKNVQ